MLSVLHIHIIAFNHFPFYAHIFFYIIFYGHIAFDICRALSQAEI